MDILNFKKASIIFIILFSNQIFAESVTVPAPSSASTATAAPNTNTPAAPVSGAAGTAPASSRAGTTPSSSAAGAAPAPGNTPTATATATAPTGANAQNNTAPKNEAKASSPKGASSDNTITAAIQASIATNDITKSTNIDVSAKSGTVKLVGSVNSDKEASELIEIAESTANVKDVNTAKLTIKGTDKLAEDSVITAKVKGTLIREKLVNTKDIMKPIQVNTAHGIVTLTGTVANQSQVDKAVKVTKAVKGVYKVKSEIVVIEEGSKK